MSSIKKVKITPSVEEPAYITDLGHNGKHNQVGDVVLIPLEPMKELDIEK